MLILTRRVGESIKIGDDVSISVLRIKGNQVRIGVDAPKSLPVRREELELREAAAIDAADTPTTGAGDENS